MRDPVRIPEGLDAWRRVPGGEAWLAALPALVARFAAEWGLRLESPFEPATMSYVAPAVLVDGRQAVLKVTFPDPESAHEAAALAHWGGEGAVRLLAADAAGGALLVERCEPGTQLWDVGEDEALERVAGVLAALGRRPVGEGAPFRRLADLAAAWAVELPVAWERLGRPCERRLLDEALAFLAQPRPCERFLLHQDLHGGNVLRASRGWLAIDPKPLVGERAFDAASYLRDRRAALVADPAAGARVVRRRLEALSDALALDRARLRGWGIVHALAWGFSARVESEPMVACARWLADA